MSEPFVARDHQIIEIGKKGSGKSYGIRYHVAPITGRLVVINVKNDPTLSAHLRHRYDAKQVKRDPKKIGAAIRDHRVVEYIPTHAHALDEFDELYLELAKWVDLTVWLDEAHGPTTSSRMSIGLTLYLQHGRSRRLRHYAASQRTKHVAKALLTEADHIVFYPAGFSPEDFPDVAQHMGLKPADLERIVRSLERDHTALGDHAHLWYERSRPGMPRGIVHRRPSVPMLP